MEVACRLLQLDALSEVAMATVCRHIVGVAMEMSRSNCLLFARHCLLPKVCDKKYLCIITIYIVDCRKFVCEVHKKDQLVSQLNKKQQASS